MMIKAVKFRRDGFYSQPFVFGGEEHTGDGSLCSYDYITNFLTVTDQIPVILLSRRRVMSE